MELIDELTELARQAGMNELVQLLTYGVLMVQLIMGILSGFFGFKLVKMWTLICGFFMGVSIGYYAARSFTSGPMMWFALIVGGVIMAVLSQRIPRLGMFVLGIIMTLSFFDIIAEALLIEGKYKELFMAVGIVGGMVAGAVLSDKARNAVIIFTGIRGGASIAAAMAGFMDLDTTYMKLAVIGLTVVISGMGIGVQFAITKKK